MSTEAVQGYGIGMQYKGDVWQWEGLVPNWSDQSMGLKRSGRVQ